MPDECADLAWIAADWGTTNLRLWGMDNNNQVLIQAQSGDGMASVDSGGFEAVLLSKIEPWLPPLKCTPVFACGMVGARQGWVEVPYASVPCAPIDAERIVAPQCVDSRIQVFIVGGLSQDFPADVMRGEETQLAGLLAAHPQLDAVICMPGTHTKWVRVSNGIIQEFKTCMTGEVFSLLANQSVLKHSVQTSEIDMPAFKATVRRAMQTEQSLADLFGIRAAHLLHDTTAASARATLSALLIASEIKMFDSVFEDQQVVLLGADAIVELYEAALSEAGTAVQRVDARALTLAGLTAVRRLSGFS